MSGYTAEFFTLEEEVAATAADAMLPTVTARLFYQPGRVIDVGCGTGAWLAAAKTLGWTVYGVDGHVPAGLLRIGVHEFDRVDLEAGVDCAGFDLAICMEVGEHLSADAAPRLVEGLCQARFVLFSAAIPGQNGVDHINEQWGSWWADLFAGHGFAGSSDVKWWFWDDRRPAGFYRQNVLVFAEPDDLAEVGLRQGVVDVIHPERLGVW